MADYEDRLALLEQQQALQTEAIQRILEGRWQGVDGAAGLVVALLGGREIDAKPFPEC